MVLMDTVALDRDVAVRRIATAEPRAADHALRRMLSITNLDQRSIEFGNNTQMA